MKQTVNFYSFRQAFIDHDRQDNFPNGGLSVLWDYLEQYEEDTGEDIELDVVALCCDYCQMSFEDVARDYGVDVSERYDQGGDNIAEIITDYLNENTSVVGEVGDDEIIFQCF